MLIFNSWRTEGRSNIYVADDDGSDLRILTAELVLRRYQRLRISPDHTRLLFLAQPSQEATAHFFFWDFNTARSTGYGLEPRPYDIRWLTNVRLLCTKRGTWWMVDLATGETDELDFGKAFLVLDVAPGGDRLLMKKARGVGSVCVGDIDRRQAREIVHQDMFGKSHAIVYPAAWSPNGDLIVCVGGYEDEVWLVNADGSHPHKVAETDYFWRTIQWSPDGRSIAYTRSLDQRGPDAELGAVFVMDLAGGVESQALRLKRGETWVWGKDGNSLVVARNADGTASLYRVDIRTQSEAELIGPSAGLADVSELIVA
jgi:Tol biopolymer transport system component